MYFAWVKATRMKAREDERRCCGSGAKVTERENRQVYLSHISDI